MDDILTWYHTKEQDWKERNRRMPKPEPVQEAPVYVWLSGQQGTYVRPGSGALMGRPTWTNFKEEVIEPLKALHRASVVGVEKKDRNKFRNTGKRIRRARRNAW